MVNGIFKYAAYYFKESSDIKEAVLGSKHNSVIETMEQLAIAMYGLGAYAPCHATLRSIHSRSNSRALAARTWNAIAIVHFQKGEFDFAFKCAQRATVKNDQSELSATIAMANLGYMQMAQKMPEGQKTLAAAEEVSWCEVYMTEVYFINVVSHFVYFPFQKLAEWLYADNEIVQSVRYNMNK